MENVEIVKLTPDEWQAYKKIRLEALKNDPHAFGQSYKNMQHKPDSYWQQRLNDAAKGNANWLLFAKHNDQIIGIIGAYIGGSEDIVDIIAVYLTPKARGKGISKILMQTLLEEIGYQSSIKKIKLTVNVDQAPAIALYKGCGFEIIGEKDDQLGDGEIHRQYIMGKEIR